MKNSKDSSPFSALTFEEQQHRWLMWRSQQLEYKQAPIEEKMPTSPLPPIPIPDLRLQDRPMQPQNRHAQLDRVYLKHKQASQNSLNWQNAVNPSKTSE